MSLLTSIAFGFKYFSLLHSGVLVVLVFLLQNVVVTNTAPIQSDLYPLYFPVYQLIVGTLSGTPYILYHEIS